MTINDYMTITEAAQRWGKSLDTLRDRLKGRSASALKDLEYLKANGLVKRFVATNAKRGEWILHVGAMEYWYGPENK